MTVSEQIIQVLDALCAKFGLAIDWTGENVIPYLNTLGRKLISYEIWTSVFWIGIMTALTIASGIATKKLYPILKQRVDDEDWDECMWSVISGILVVASIILYGATIIVIGVQITDIIECTVFPEKYIFEYVQHIINAGS